MNSIDWKREDLVFCRKSIRKTRSIWLTKLNGRGNPSVLNISPDVMQLANLKNGDSIWLYSSGNLFMIKKEPSDFVIKQRTSNTAGILTNINFVAHLRAYENGTEYDAWVDNGNILFKPKENHIGI